MAAHAVVRGRSKIWLSLLLAVITWPVNLSLRGRRGE